MHVYVYIKTGKQYDTVPMEQGAEGDIQQKHHSPHQGPCILSILLATFRYRLLICLHAPTTFTTQRLLRMTNHVSNLPKSTWA